MKRALEGKVAIITGGAGGQGDAEVRLFLAEGAKVVFTDVAEESGQQLAAELGADTLFLRHDITREENWKNVVDAAISRFGGIDILINNAGISNFQSIDTTTRADMQRFLDVNLIGAMLGIQAVMNHMHDSGGSIVNVASLAALSGRPNYLPYGVSKWALRGLSRYAARDLVRHGIRVNTIMPGGVETPMLPAPGTDARLDRARASVPMKRFADPAEIARAVLFLASDASSYMTGSEMVIDGGAAA